MNRIRFQFRNPYPEYGEAVTTQEPITPSVAFFLLCDVMPIVPVYLNNNATIRNKEIASQSVYGGLMNIFDIQGVKQIPHGKFWFADEGSASSIVSVKGKVMALNGTVLPSTLIQAIPGNVKRFTAFFADHIFTSAPRCVSTGSRTKSLACVIAWLEGIPASFTRTKCATGGYAFAFAGAKAPCSCFAAMAEGLAAYFADSCWITATCTRASQRAKLLVGIGLANYSSITMNTGYLT